MILLRDSNIFYILVKNKGFLSLMNNNEFYFSKNYNETGRFSINNNCLINELFKKIIVYVIKM